jgi:7-cyano-7-deazaguanine synthase
MSKPKAVCLLSGGMDSLLATKLAELDGYDIYALTFSYGQTPCERELSCAKKLATWIGAKEHKIIDIAWLKEIGGSALTAGTELTKNNKHDEYVPFRNTIFISIATAWAEVLGAAAVFIGANAGDVICPDTTTEYIDLMQKVITSGTKMNKNIKICAPLREKNFTKNEIISEGMKLNLPFELTWACHNSNDVACGICNNCVSRLSAFEHAKYEDKLIYRT